MSLNTIRIPDILLGELYRDNLLATTAYPSPVVEETTGTLAPAPVAKASIPAAPIVSAPLPEPMVGKTTTPAAATTIAPPATVNTPAAPKTASAPVTPATSTAPPASTGQAPLSNPPPPANTAKRESVTTPEPAAAPASAASNAAPGYKTLGNNRRNITILVQNPGIAFLADDQLTFLTKILEACRLNIGDVAIVNCATAPVTITALRQQLRPSVLLLFGLDPLQIQLPISFPVFKIQEYDAAAYLCAPPLDQLVKNTPESKLLKSRLWVCLKTLFNV